MHGILESVGAFGRYQKLALILTGLSSFISSGLVYSIIFVTADPRVLCTTQLQTANNSNPDSEAKTCELWPNKSNECRFEDKYYGHTVVTDLELICDKKFYASISQTLLLFGQFSSAILGYLSDRFGRKWALLLSTRTTVIVLLICSLSNLNILNLSLSFKFIIFCITQYFNGILSAGLFSIIFIVSVEMTTEKYKTIATNANMFMYVVGELVVMIVYYFSRDWKVIYYFLAAYSVVISILAQLLLFESPLFLLKSKKYNETYELLKKIAKLNGKLNEIEENLQAGGELMINEDLNEEYCINELKKLNSSKAELDIQAVKKKPDGAFGYVFKSRKNIFTVLALIYIWISICLVFFGISLGNEVLI
jgi:MFS family permease